MDRPGRTRVLIVGAGSLARDLARNLQDSGRYHVLGFVADGTETDDECLAKPLLGLQKDTATLVKQFSVDKIYVAYTPVWQQQIIEQVAAAGPDVEVCVVPGYLESMMSTNRVHHQGDIAVVRLQCGADRFYSSIKRLVDLIASAVGIVVLAPLMLVVGLLVKLTSRGPAIFRQERVGRHGKTFEIIKFRTMRADAEELTGPVLAAGDADTRLTPFGRWLREYRIDEIPQLWNVLRGEMSLVGPRPERTCFVEQFEKSIPAYTRRHLVRPGITGLAQICGGYHTDPADKLRFDLIYVAHQSLWYDLLILFRTIRVVLFPGTKTQRTDVERSGEPDPAMEGYAVSSSVRGPQEL